MDICAFQKNSEKFRNSDFFWISGAHWRRGMHLGQPAGSRRLRRSRLPLARPLEKSIEVLTKVNWKSYIYGSFGSPNFALRFNLFATR